MLRWSCPQILVLVGSLLTGCNRGGAGECEARVAVMRDVFARIPSDVLTAPLLEDDRPSDLVTSAHGQPFVRADVTIHILATGQFRIGGIDRDLGNIRYALEEEFARRDRIIASEQEIARNPPPPSPPTPLSANPGEFVLGPGDENRFVGYLNTPDIPPEGEDRDPLDGEGDHPIKPPRVPGARVYLAVTPTAPLTGLFSLLRMLPAGVVVSLIVRDPRKMPSEAELPAAVVPALRRIQAWEADIRANRRLTDDPPLIETMTTCAAFRPLIGRTDLVSHADRERVWMQEAPGIALECGCNGVDVEGLAAITWWRIRPDLPLLRLLPLRWTDDPGAERVELPATARGADLIRAVEARGAAAVHLTLAP